MNELYERPKNVSESPSVKAGALTKIEQPIKMENIDRAEAVLPAQIATELTIDTTTQPQKSADPSPGKLSSPPKHSPNGSCSMDVDQATCSGESKANGEQKSAEVSPIVQGLFFDDNF
jgi:hypothetical protein